ncbi:MAG: DUF5117 domain-containing protein, partial [Aliifodinibius sp.]|nr:DUF5117 domain-containing protein [Candidatus Dadabacteria bacterium]NIT58335.1 DUF5117 domain-containing protein [Fodinibius sp.]NIV13260.1 DUF5117 domain-containing protein [Fodinibius sp.]NIY26918.1 DUF5117 domain-containing protein [Fodinibius sp.]
TFPENVLAKSNYTTTISEGGPSVPLSIGVTTNIVLLSKEPLHPKKADRRIGYFSR